ncbi:MAG: signal peptide peptidase SppA [Bacteroidales bacterium]|nr:signal peptide peptidase SppA [Bacteroidales bacterium]
MKDFIKMTLACLTGLLLLGFISTFLFVTTIGAVVALGNKQPQMPSSAVLYLDMSTIMLTEQTQEPDPLSILQGDGTEVQPLGIYSAIRTINTAAEDPAVKFIYMKPDGVMGGLAQIEELRTALVNFRSSGKAIISYMETPTNAGYYLASVSDKIYMTSHDGGTNLLTGVSSQMIFLKDLLDRIGVNVQLIRHGKYKSAGEMFIRETPSKENLEQNEAMIQSIWENWAGKIAESREIDLTELNAMLNNLELNFPEDFLEKGLVDGLVTYEQMRQKVADLYGVFSPKDVESVSLYDYALIREPINLNPAAKVAVIYIDGDIVDGKDAQQQVVAGDRFAKIISDVRNDDMVKAAVLRVNSPGGSVLASEKIKAEIALLKEKIPVVASYSNYAASGGYWISAGCDKIYTNATTLTGSIGVFSMIPDFSKTLDDRLHVGITPVNSNRHSDMYGMMRPLTDKEVAYMQASVEKIYGKFTGLVAEGRNMTVEQVDEIAQGRVWTGSEACDLGLADHIGTIEDAISDAVYMAIHSAELDDISQVSIVGYPKPLTSIELLMESLGGTQEQNILSDTPFSAVGEAFRNWTSAQSGKVYARMPYEYVIR